MLALYFSRSSRWTSVLRGSDADSDWHRAGRPLTANIKKNGRKNFVAILLIDDSQVPCAIALPS
jgi:hypothetical protein